MHINQSVRDGQLAFKSHSAFHSHKEARQSIINLPKNNKLYDLAHFIYLTDLHRDVYHLLIEL